MVLFIHLIINFWLSTDIWHYGSGLNCGLKKQQKTNLLPSWVANAEVKEISKELLHSAVFSSLR